MTILYLSLKKEWYEMIESGEKREEYRELKEYWFKRLADRHYDAVQFSYGYTKRTMLFEVKGIIIGRGNSKWGAPDKDVFIIKLGNRLK